EVARTNAGGGGQPVLERGGLGLALEPVHDRTERRPVAEGEPDLVGEIGPRVERDGNVIEVAHADAAGLQAVTDRLLGEAGPVLDPVEPLPLDRGYQFAVDQECRRGVAVKGVDAEDIHAEVLPGHRTDPAAGVSFAGRVVLKAGQVMSKDYGPPAGSSIGC